MGTFGTVIFGDGVIPDPTGGGQTPPANQLPQDTGGGGWLNFFQTALRDAAGAYTAYNNANAVNDFNKARAAAGLYPASYGQFFGTGAGANVFGGSFSGIFMLLLVVVVFVAIISAVGGHRR